MAFNWVSAFALHLFIFNHQQDLTIVGTKETEKLRKQKEEKGRQRNGWVGEEEQRKEDGGRGRQGGVSIKGRGGRENC
jgi:hypothetical protein